MRQVQHYVNAVNEYEELRQHVIHVVQQAREQIFYNQEFQMNTFKDTLETLEDLAQMCGIDTTYDT
jgi:hypothetical protein